MSFLLPEFITESHKIQAFSCQDLCALRKFTPQNNRFPAFFDRKMDIYSSSHELFRTTTISGGFSGKKMRKSPISFILVQFPRNYNFSIFIAEKKNPLHEFSKIQPISILKLKHISSNDLKKHSYQ